jgi:heat-inducible transcriptional repressor
MDLDERKAAILRAIVEEHIATAQPVGSQTVAKSAGLAVSSATVRNEMTILEREGFIAQPHTSAGRIPTDRGYRFFVDTLTRQGALPVDQRRAVNDFFELFTSAHQVLEDLLHETSQLLSRVSTHTAVVVGPHTESVTIRSVQLVSLQPSLVLALAILSNGVVEKCVLHLAADVDAATVVAATAALDSSLEGVRWPLTADPLVASSPAAADLAREARDALVARGDHDVTDPR